MKGILFEIAIITTFITSICYLIHESQAQLFSPELTEARGYIRNKPKFPESLLRANLPHNIVPKSYTLKLRLILDSGESFGEQWTAPGHVDIQILAIESTNEIVIHRHPNITINESTAVVTNTHGSVIRIVRHFFVTNDTLHTFILEEDLVGGSWYTLSLDFVAPISDSKVGLYRAIVKDDAGIETRMAFTQFEPSSARNAFPCFDEPRWRTPFTISLGYKNGTLSTLSNAKKRIVAEPDPNDKNWVWDHYDTTVRMPTYLVAIIVSNFDFVQASRDIFGDRPVRVYAQRQYIAPGGKKSVGGGSYAVNASAQLLAFFESTYKYPYEMLKMDVAAIPESSYYEGNLAMENWGLITQREDQVLFFEGQQSWFEKEQITGCLSHEIAHQWFGNLVTCKTWAHVWLNEGFATYISTFGVEAINPEWMAVRGMLWGNVQYAMKKDVTSNSSIIGLNVPGTLTYSKGAAIIRMMEGFLGKETLTRGLINYLNTYAYKSVVQDQLFEKLTVQAWQDNKLPPKKTVKEIMDTWTLQPGFPLIRVYKGSDSYVYISQGRFLPTKENKSDASFLSAKQYYQVPIAIAIEGDNVFSNYTPKVWLTQKKTWVRVAHDTSKWIIVNPDAMGYYRVFYDEELTVLILSQLHENREAISGLSRSQLIDDYFELAKYGHISITKALEMTTWLKTNKGYDSYELDRAVWNTVFSALFEALTMFQVHNGERFPPNHSLKDYLLPKIEGVLEWINWTQPPEDLSAVFRTKLVDWACALGSKECLGFAKWFMNFWMKSLNSTPLDDQPLMYCIGIKQGGELEFNFALKNFTEAPVGDFKPRGSNILKGLACVRNVTLIHRLLDLAIDNSSAIGKYPRYASLVIRRVASSIVGKTIMLKFLDDNFSVLVERLGGVTFIGKVLKTLSTLCASKADLASFYAFIDKRATELIPVQASLSTSLETIQTNIEWMDQNFDIMDSWFKSHINFSIFIEGRV